MIRYVRMLLVVLLFVYSTASAAPLAPTVDISKPVEITARQLEVIQSDNKSVFSGDVVAKQGDMTLTANQLTVFSAAGEQIDRLEAVGQVRFVQGENTATADRAVYRQKEEILVLQGNATVAQGNNRVSGDEIVFYIRENRSLVKSSDQKRIKAVIVPTTQQEPR